MEKLLGFFQANSFVIEDLIISRYDMIIFIYISWSVNSGWLTLFASSKVTRGDSFDFKMLLTVFSKSKVFNKYIELFFSRTDGSVLPSQLNLLTENLLANCHFSKKDILQMIRNPDLNKAHVHDMINIRVLKVLLWLGLPIPRDNF